jgi:hypothetical protein
MHAAYIYIHKSSSDRLVAYGGSVHGLALASQHSPLLPHPDAPASYIPYTTPRSTLNKSTAPAIQAYVLHAL